MNDINEADAMQRVVCQWSFAYRGPRTRNRRHPTEVVGAPPRFGLPTQAWGLCWTMTVEAVFGATAIR